jgi:hypothetical protein
MAAHGVRGWAPVFESHIQFLTCMVRSSKIRLAINFAKKRGYWTA